MKYTNCLFYLLVFLSSCHRSEDQSLSGTPLLRLHAPESSGVNFSNTLYETTELNILTFEYLYNGAGVAVGDFNGDDLPDLYFSGNMTRGKLYLNRGNFIFEDITEQAGINTDQKWGTGVSVVDINNDDLSIIQMTLV